MIKLTYHVDVNGQIFNTTRNKVTSSTTVKINPEKFDDGSEEEFLIFKRNFEQIVEEWELTPQDPAHGARHLYAALRKSLSGNILDERMDIMENTTTLNYRNFLTDLWALIERQTDADAARK